MVYHNHMHSRHTINSSYRCTKACRFRFGLEFWVLRAFLSVFKWCFYVFSFVYFEFGSQYQCSWLPASDPLFVESDVKLYSLTCYLSHHLSYLFFCSTGYNGITVIILTYWTSRIVAVSCHKEMILVPPMLQTIVGWVFHRAYYSG